MEASAGGGGGGVGCAYQRSAQTAAARRTPPQTARWRPCWWAAQAHHEHPHSPNQGGDGALDRVGEKAVLELLYGAVENEGVGGVRGSSRGCTASALASRTGASFQAVILRLSSHPALGS